MENKQVTPERVLIVAMVEPGKPDPLTVLHRIQTVLEGTEGVVSVNIQQVGNVPMAARLLERDLEQIINSRCLENGSNTPDFILASFLKSCLDTWNLHTRERDRWFGNRSVLGPGNDLRLSRRAVTRYSDLTRAPRQRGARQHSSRSTSRWA